MPQVPDADPNKTYPPTHVFYVVDAEGKPSKSKLYLHLVQPKES